MTRGWSGVLLIGLLILCCDMIVAATALQIAARSVAEKIGIHHGGAGTTTAAALAGLRK